MYAVRSFGEEEIVYKDEIESGKIDEKGREIIYVPPFTAALKENQVIVPIKPEKTTFKETFDEGIGLAQNLYDCPEANLPLFKALVGVSQSSFFLDRFTPNLRYQVAGLGRFAPIIACRGPSGSGKNRALAALRLNSYRPFYDQSTKRVPSLFRPLDLWRGTLCLDECDLGDTDESAEVTHYLNCRAYGTPISRQNPNNASETQTFYNFGQTQVTQRRVWDDDALENRTLPNPCEKSQKELPTTELEEWIEKGFSLQNHLLWLRLMYWDKVNIKKAARVKDLRDHRLTASILPLLALSDFAPDMIRDLVAILQTLDRRRREVRAMSKDGVIVNYLWSKIEDGLVGVWNNECYVGGEREQVGKDHEAVVIPLQIRELEENLNFSGREARKVIQSLTLVREDVSLPSSIRVGTRKYRAIMLHPERLEVRLRDFVPEYEEEGLKTHLPQTVLEAYLKRPSGAGSVPIVPSVPKPELETNSGTLGTDGPVSTPLGGRALQ